MHLPRRLWFEDNSGGRHEIREHELLSRQESLVVLGEPGTGKSKLLERLAEQAGVAAIPAIRLINRPDPCALLGQAKLIVVDALDEVATKEDGDAVDRVLQKLSLLGYPRFVLSCRVADWHAATSIAAICGEYAQAPVQMHLTLLDPEEQHEILSDLVGIGRAEGLLAHFESFGLDFLGNPQTLQLVAKLPKGRPLPASSSALFDLATSTLRKEHNDRKAPDELSEEQALDAAGAAFASLILSGNSSIVRKGSANLSEGELAIAELEGLGGGNVARVTDTKLFAGGADSFTYWHRRVGEFLGAKWLSKRADTSRKRKRLLSLFHAQKLVPANLRGLHAWLALDFKLAPAVIAADPMGVVEYGDADILIPTQSAILFDALKQLASVNPGFRQWQRGRASSLVSAALSNDARRLALDKSAPFQLRLLVIEQMGRDGHVHSFKMDLRIILLYPSEDLAIRREAATGLTNSDSEEWPVIAEDLRRLADRGSRRLAAQLLEDLDLEVFSDEQIVQILLAFYGLTLTSIRSEPHDNLVVQSARIVARLSQERLNSLLDVLTDYVSELLPNRPIGQYSELIEFAFDVILRRLESGDVDALRLWCWLRPYRDQHEYCRGRGIRISNWLVEHEDIRRQIQRHVLLGDLNNSIANSELHLVSRSGGLRLTDSDIVELLATFSPADRTNMRWRDLIMLARHSQEEGIVVREAARRFAAHDPQLANWLDALAFPYVPRWKIKQDKLDRKRKAERAMEIAEERRKCLKEIDDIRAGKMEAVWGPACRYFLPARDGERDLPAHERIAHKLGPEVAAAAHIGFIAFLLRQPARPNARQIAVLHAVHRYWTAGLIIVAGFAELVRTRDTPFEGLVDERLMAGMFEIWQSRINVHDAATIDLSTRIEQELRLRGAWEAAVRLYIVPQFKQGSAQVEGLYNLMRADNDELVATTLAANWLTQCPDLAAEPEAQMIDRLLRSRRYGELRAIGERRRAQELDDVRRLNWDAVQLLVDFDAAHSRFGMTVDYALLWHLRARGSGGSRRENSGSCPLDIAQLTWIIAIFRNLWPFVARPKGGTTGSKNAWDASEYLTERIFLLRNETSDDAFAALEGLVNLPSDGYTASLRFVAAEQRQKRVERLYTPPTIARIKSILNAGPPADASDLQAIVVEALELVQAELKGSNVDWYRGFYRDNGLHKDEEPCRDELIKMLRVADNEFEYVPESHGADDTRVDVVVRANASLILPIEIKGQWHAQLWTAADTQLDRLYLNDWRAERGIYLVLWFGPTVFLPKPGGAERPTTSQELREALVRTSAACRDGRVAVVVLDFTRPSPP